MITFMLDTDTWDIVLSSSNNIEIATDDYAIAQTCANAVRLFTNDAYFDQQRGIPHFDIELGQHAMPNKVVIQNRIKQACLAVDGVTDCEVVLTDDVETRTLNGQASVATVNGAKINIEL